MFYEIFSYESCINDYVEIRQIILHISPYNWGRVIKRSYYFGENKSVYQNSISGWGCVISYFNGIFLGQFLFRNPYLFDMDFSIFFHSCANNSRSKQDIQFFSIYLNNSFAIRFSTILTWFLSIFTSRIPESGFLSGSPVFQKVHIWNLHVMGTFWIQKFSRTKFVRDPDLLGNGHF